MCKRRTRQSATVYARTGAAAVEFALTAPILFLLVFGLIEMARLYQVNGICTTAAVIAARSGAVVNSRTDDVQAAVAKILDPLGVNDRRVTLTPPVITNATEELTVTIEVPLNMRNGFVFTKFVKGKSLRRQVTRTRKVSQS